MFHYNKQFSWPLLVVIKVYLFTFQLIKHARLNPPITYHTPLEYSLVLEPIAHFCKGVDKSIFTKLSAIKSPERSEVYINIDEDLTGILTNDSTIVYKLKVIFGK